MQSAYISVITLLVLPCHSTAAPARHFSYSGNDPTHWTSNVLDRADAGTPSDFTVFPCNAANCTVAQVITDAEGNTYATGSRLFPSQTGQLSDVYVVKLDPTGAAVFLATFSGKGNDEAHGIALDGAGNIYLGGSTSSVNFPIRNAIQPERGRGAGFLMKLSPDASRLLYSTYFGGTSEMSSVEAIAADAAGNLYITGQTGAREFPATPGMPDSPITGIGPGGTIGAFVAKLSPAGDRILYSGRISGSSLACTGGSSCFLSIRSTSGKVIGLDAHGNAYVIGNTNVTNLPVTSGALKPTGIGAWAARIGAAGKLDYLTYLSHATYGSGTFVSAATNANGLAVDAAGNAYIVGLTSDPRFPTTAGAVQTSYGGPMNPPPVGPAPPSDAFVAKLNPQGAGLVYATFLGGPGADAAKAIALNASGAAYVSGTSDSSNFLQGTGGDFLVVLDPTGSRLAATARYPTGSVSRALAVDNTGGLRVAGASGVISSLNLATPSSPRLFGITSAAGGQLSAVVAPGEVISVFGSGLGPSTTATAQPGPDGRMPTALAGTQLFFDGVAAPLLYVSPEQINAVAPFALIPDQRVTVRVGTTSGTFELRGTTVAARPAIFGFGSAAAMNQDGTVNSASNPARPGSVVSIWATGTGSFYPIPDDGQITTEARNSYCCSITALYSSSAEVLYAGPAPGMVAGVTQINFRVPADNPLGASQPMPIALSVSGQNPGSPAPSTSSIFVTP